MEFWDDSQAAHQRRAGARRWRSSAAFSGHIVHDKQLFEVLFDSRRPRPSSTEEEIAFVEETVPMTAFLNDDQVNIDADPRQPRGVDHQAHRPLRRRQRVRRLRGDVRRSGSASSTSSPNERAGYPFIVQRYIRPFKTDTLPPDARHQRRLPDGAVESEPVPYNNLNGLYLYNGHVPGRLQPAGAAPHDFEGPTHGMTAATIWVDCDVPDGLEL